MSRQSIDYVFRNPPSTLNVVNNIHSLRCDDLLHPATLQLFGTFAPGSVSVEIIIDNTNAVVLPGFGAVTANTVVQLPVCSEVRLVLSGADPFTSVDVRVGGLAYTTHPDNTVQGPT